MYRFNALVKITLLTSYLDLITAMKARWLFQPINLKIVYNLFREKCDNGVIEEIDAFCGWLCVFLVLTVVLLNASSFSFKDLPVT